MPGAELNQQLIVFQKFSICGQQSSRVPAHIEGFAINQFLSWQVCLTTERHIFSESYDQPPNHRFQLKKIIKFACSTMHLSLLWKTGQLQCVNLLSEIMNPNVRCSCIYIHWSGHIVFSLFCVTVYSKNNE